MSWQIYLLISIILISGNSIFQRSLMRDEQSHAQATTVAGLGISGFIALFFVLLQGKLNLLFPVSLVFAFILFILLVTPGYVLSRQAIKLIGASEIIIILATGRLWNVIGAYFFLNEHVTIQRIFGALIILTGVAIARYEKKRFVVNKGFWLAVAASFCLGMSDVVGYYILNYMTALNFLVYSYFLPVITILLLQSKTITKLRYFFQPMKGMKLILLSLFDTFGMLALYLSYQAGGAASIIGPLSTTRVLVTIGLAMLLLKERENIANKIVGSIVTIVGVILLL